MRLRYWIYQVERTGKLFIFIENSFDTLEAANQFYLGEFNRHYNRETGMVNERMPKITIIGFDWMIKAPRHITFSDTP